MPGDERENYRAARQELLRPHSREELKRRVKDQLLPILLPTAHRLPPTA